MKKFIIFIFTLSFIYASENLKDITIQLPWKYQFEFAGFIAAIEKGYYKDEGLNVILKEYSNDIDIVQEVIDKKVDMGINNSLLMYKNRKLLPVVLLASYYQKSPLILVTQENINKPEDLIGKTIMGTNPDLYNSPISLFFNHFFITNENTKFVNHQFNVDDFINKKIDAMAIFSSNEGYDLDKLKYNYNTYDPVNYGFLATANNLFTSKNYAIQNQETIKRFLEASQKGWKYAFDNKQELIDIIYYKYSKHKSKDALMFEAKESEKLFQKDLTQIGSIPKEFYIRILKQLKYTQQIDDEQNLNEYFFDDFITRKNEVFNLTKEEKDYLKKKKEITVCVDPDWMPFESLQKGKHIGIAADIFDIFRTKIDIPLTVIPTKSWEQSIQYAQNRICDIFSLASENPQRKKYMDFTTAYLDLPIVIATKSDKIFVDNLETIKDKKIGVVKGYSIGLFLKQKYPDINLVEVKNIHEGLDYVSNGDLYCYVDNLMTIARTIQIYYTGELKISGRLDDKVALGVGTRNDEPILNSIFQKLVNIIDDEKKQSIYNKWISVTENVGLDYYSILKIVAIIVIILLMFLYHYFQLRKYNKTLYHISITDKLTKLFNRSKLDEVLNERYEQTTKNNIDNSIIIADIDFFKSINDTYGHLFGDEILKEFSLLLQKHTRKTDFVGRWGGEEFMIILSNTKLDDAITFANKLKDTIEKTIFYRQIQLTSSFGVGIIDKNLTLVQNINQIDNALYKAKALGRNKVIEVN